MSRNLISYMEESKELIHDGLISCLEKLDIPDNLKQAMLYSVKAGGKRLRPVLLFSAFEAYGEDNKKAISSAIALELIHTYSLVHDDLPAMDNDDYRRGKLTNHKVFGEANAILAGDALLTYSFELIANDPLLQDAEKVELIKSLSRASGPKGMVGGQILDMEAENKATSLTELERIHVLKTGELLQFAVYSGAYLGGASTTELAALNDFSYYLGLIFQIQDDILDVTGDSQKMGKQVGSDEGNNKSTYPKLLGLDGAIEQKNMYAKKAKEALKEANAAHSNLMALTDHFSNRDH
ncbi:polyprenyl synthetase family protein [Virgibacillus halodenitrificans]|uniref:polyprenyl synthetase family protein n=1 Tax=Virgibacillus halodenitrificans TaxID=1482 RepID=UPI00136D416B|nr:farnesyl diphosphate synthase [Virgibacillus halodenitrificans]MEC2158391.1 polyprenyl synthetase family protein [Virgibacillus halodenitrificans]MYL57642.1 polyprenyl synthetase family protein [Virgibacillus halodenitrificans]